VNPAPPKSAPLEDAAPACSSWHTSLVYIVNSSNRQAYRFIPRPWLDFDGMLNAIRIPERHSADFHDRQNSYFAFCSLRTAHHIPRFLVLQKTDKARMSQVTIRSPFNELELPDQRRFKPAAFLHLLGI
jgi:hypothetical protein